MSTSVALISEGPIDQVLLEPLLGAIAKKKAGFDWPIAASDGAEVIPIRKRGFGGVVAKLRALIELLDEIPLDYEGYIIVLDRRTKAAQEEIRELIKGQSKFVLAIAKEEIEAWWLGDRDCTLHWVGFPKGAPRDTRYAAKGYKAEKDNDPKKTLDELTARSPRLESRYGQGSVQLAADFAETWDPSDCLEKIRAQCPEGFGAFVKHTSRLFNGVKKRRRSP